MTSRQKIDAKIKDQALNVIAKFTKQAQCSHAWKEDGLGFICIRCEYYTGLDEELNKLIRKLKKNRNGIYK